MPFLIERKDTQPPHRWRPVIATDTWCMAESFLGDGAAQEAAAAYGIEYRIEELTKELVSYRFAKAVADDALARYVEANRLAYDLKLKTLGRSL